MGIKKQEIDEVKMNLLAQRIEHLLRFAGSLIPEIETLEGLYENSKERESFAESAAPLLTAFGIDYEEKSFEANLHKKRALALVNLVKVLRDTELERSERKKTGDERRKLTESLFGNAVEQFGETLEKLGDDRAKCNL